MKLPPAAVFVALLAQEHNGTKTRWSHPVRLAPARGSQPVALTPVLAGKPAAPVELARLPGKGPFGLRDAWVVTAPSRPALSAMSRDGASSAL